MASPSPSTAVQRPGSGASTFAQRVKGGPPSSWVSTATRWPFGSKSASSTGPCPSVVVAITRSGTRGCGRAGERKMEASRWSAHSSGTLKGAAGRILAAPRRAGPGSSPSTVTWVIRERKSSRELPAPSVRSLTAMRSTRRIVSASGCSGSAQGSTYSLNEWSAIGAPDASSPR